MQDFSDLEYRKSVLETILSKENIERKTEAFKRSEIYNKRAAAYIEEKLKKDFPDSVESMRKVTSINPAKRMIDNMASIYRNKPVRKPAGLDGSDLSPEQVAFVEDTYENGSWNTLFQKSNRFKKLQHQAFLQVLPLKGYISGRVYQPHQIDAVGLENDPETAFGYVISDYQNESSKEDKKEPADLRFVWWSAKHNLITDGEGNQIADSTGSMELANPIGRLNIVEISEEKENAFWVAKGSSVCDFVVDLGVILSDTANTNRLQAYGQPVITSKDNPGPMRTGAERVIWLKQDPDKDQKDPKIEFINANPDLESSMKLITVLMNLFATSEGQSPKLVSTTGEVDKYASGLDRFLAQIEAFEASKEDLEQFRVVEQEVFELIMAWANIYAGSSNAPLKTRATSFSEDIYLQVQFSEPQLIQSKAEKEELEYKRVERGISSLVQAVMNIFEIDEPTAIERIEKVKEHQALLAPSVVTESADVEASAATAPSADVTAVTTESGKVADSALNGAQVSAMVEVVQQVANGLLPRESGIFIIQKAFLITPEEAEKLMGSAGNGFTPKTEEPTGDAPPTPEAV